MMSRVLGMPGYAFAVIDHPVSSATDAELKAARPGRDRAGLKLLVQAVREPAAARLAGMKPLVLLGSS